MSRRRLAVLTFLGAALAQRLLACSSDMASERNGLPDGGKGDAGPVDGGPAEVVSATGVILVHAASFPAFRVCFEGRASDEPAPSAAVLPRSNVVGVDVGGAVRLGGLPDAVGRVWVFPETAIRALYPPGKKGPTCGALLDGATSKTAVLVGQVNGLGDKVHVLALTGCPAITADPQATRSRCGPDYDGTTGNLQMKDIPVVAFSRPDRNLGIQFLQLSTSLDAYLAGDGIGVGYGVVSPDAGIRGTVSVYKGPAPLGSVVPPAPIKILLDGDLPSYETVGLHLTREVLPRPDGGGSSTSDDAGSDAGPPGDAGPEADAGPPELLFATSLAAIQQSSDSRAVPPGWYGVTSNYLVFVVGERSPRLADGGLDGDERRALHVVALPVALPVDAGP